MTLFKPGRSTLLARAAVGLCLLAAGCSADSGPRRTIERSNGTGVPAAATSGAGTTGAAPDPTTGQAPATPGTGGTTTPPLGGTGGGMVAAPGEDTDAGVCEVRSLVADRTTPDMLIVLDRSGSMQSNDNGTDRFTGSIDAVNTVVGELEGEVRFGLMTFPGDDGGAQGGGSLLDQLLGGGGGGARCVPGALDVPIDLQNAAPIAGTLQGIGTGRGTPTAQTLAEARRVLAELPNDASDPEGLVIPTRYVMLVTDGDPNCLDGGGGPGGGGGANAQQATIDEVAGLSEDGVRTYVIGFETAGTDFAGVLDRMAAAGGTGDTQHRSVNTGAELLDEFRRITGSATSCTFVLSQPVDESRVEIKINGAPAVHGSDWHLTDDRTIELLPAACDALQDGALIEAQVFCHDIRLI